MSIDFRENIDPVFAKIFAKIESKIFAKIESKIFAKIVENFRENCSKIAKQFFENERKFSRNFRENRVSRFSLEALYQRLCIYAICLYGPLQDDICDLFGRNLTLVVEYLHLYCIVFSTVSLESFSVK